MRPSSWPSPRPGAGHDRRRGARQGPLSRRAVLLRSGVLQRRASRVQRGLSHLEAAGAALTTSRAASRRSSSFPTPSRCSSATSRRIPTTSDREAVETRIRNLEGAPGAPRSPPRRGRPSPPSCHRSQHHNRYRSSDSRRWRPRPRTASGSYTPGPRWAASGSARSPARSPPASPARSRTTIPKSSAPTTCAIPRRSSRTRSTRLIRVQEARARHRHPLAHRSRRRGHRRDPPLCRRAPSRRSTPAWSSPRRTVVRRVRLCARFLASPSCSRCRAAAPRRLRQVQRRRRADMGGGCTPGCDCISGDARSPCPLTAASRRS